MQAIAVIQARMSSTRLPGKVLARIGSETMLARVVERTRRAATLDSVMVACSDLPADDVLADECERLRVPFHRGSEHDVLDRYFRTLQTYPAEAVVRVTADCPLIDPEVIDRVVEAFFQEKPDYASNVLVRTFPHGLDTEVMARPALERAWREARESHQREHVTPYIWRNPVLFRLLSVTAACDYSSHRWTVDTPQDLAFVREVYARLGDRGEWSWRDVLKLADVEQGLAEPKPS